MDELKHRRKALGWSRRELAQRSETDPRVLQLLELGLSHDDEAAERVLNTLKQAEVALGLDGPAN
jgi:transcriptional regulator with XRE-family HTH domain